MTRFQYQQQLPYQQLQTFLSGVYGTPMRASEYAPAPQAQTNRIGSALGGAALGGTAASILGGTSGLFGFTPTQTALGGAGLGALGGLLF
jgi:hypothetical protein